MASVLMSTATAAARSNTRIPPVSSCGLPIVVRRAARRTRHLCPTHTRDAMYAKAIASNAKSKAKREATLKAPG